MKILFTLLLTLFFISAHSNEPPTIKKITERKTNASGSVIWKIIKEYDKEGRLIKRQYFQGASNIANYTIYTLDSLGRTTNETTYNNQEEITNTVVYKYDKQNEVISQTRAYPKRGDVYREIFNNTYNKKNNIVEQIQFDKDSVLDWVY